MFPSVKLRRSVLRNKPKCILITSKICWGTERIKYLPSSWGLFKLHSEKQHCKILLLCTALVLQFLPQLEKAQTWEPLGAIRVAPQVYMEGSPWLLGVAFSTGGFPGSEHFYSNLAGKPLKAAKGYENSFTVWLLDLLWWCEHNWGEESWGWEVQPAQRVPGHFLNIPGSGNTESKLLLCGGRCL